MGLQHYTQDMSKIPLKYNKKVLFYTKYTHPMLICRGTDGRTDRRTENIYSIFRDKLLLRREHILRPEKKVLVVCLAGCTVVSVFGSGGKQVLVVHTTMYLEYHTVVVLCYFFWFWREIDFGVTYILSVQYSCVVVSVFLLWRESYLVYNVRLCCCVSFLVVAGNSLYQFNFN